MRNNQVNICKGFRTTRLAQTPTKLAISQTGEEKGSPCSVPSPPGLVQPSKSCFFSYRPVGIPMATSPVAMVIKSLHMTSYFGNLEYSSSDTHTTAKALRFVLVCAIYLLAMSLFQSTQTLWAFSGTEILSYAVSALLCHASTPPEERQAWNRDLSLTSHFLDMLLIKEYLWRKSHLSRFSKKLVLGVFKRIKRSWDITPKKRQRRAHSSVSMVSKTGVPPCWHPCLHLSSQTGSLPRESWVEMCKGWQENVAPWKRLNLSWISFNNLVVSHFFF